MAYARAYKGMSKVIHILNAQLLVLLCALAYTYIRKVRRFVEKRIQAKI